ncbi:FAD-dependent monooxygenase [Dactylosporangium sp. NPDC051484]|uniref:FAD-dependent monooxygenase n=1 Tax=Dactylosporangium sp. NPDC051484 TaxID=3154942 RepID=UPI00344EBA25
MSVRIAIVGAGIGGLTLAVALRAAGLRHEIYEAVARPGAAGLGVQVSPNAVRPLLALGVRPGGAVPLDAVETIDRYGRPIARTPLGAACVDRFGAPYWGVRRADLHRALLDRVEPDALRLGHRLTRADPDGTLEFDGGRRTRADVVVGADGIRSVVRRALSGDAPVFSGLGAYRGLVPVAKLGPAAARPAARIWLGPDRHMVCYPVAGGRLVSFAAIAPMPAGDDRSRAVPSSSVAAEFGDWHGLAGSIARQAEVVRQWPLYDREPLRRWTAGRLTVLGDAAHPMLPFLAQGANQAVEDAVQLAACLAGTGDVPGRLARYAGLRAERTATVQRLARVQGGTGHLPDGPARLRRDRQLHRHSGLDERAWLYGFAVEGRAA